MGTVKEGFIQYGSIRGSRYETGDKTKFIQVRRTESALTCKRGQVIWKINWDNFVDNFMEQYKII